MMLSASGDPHWRHQLGLHDNIVDGVLAQHGGQRAKHTGDGIFATFDAPNNACLCAPESRGEEWSGLAVHVGARISTMAGPGEVLASRTVRDLSAGSSLKFESLGAHRLKGLSEDTDLYRVRAR